MIWRKYKMEKEKEQTENEKKELGLRVKLLRKAKGWKQKHLSEEIDESLQVISNIERGYTFPTTNQLRKLAKSLETTTDFILGVTSNPSPTSSSRTSIIIDLNKALDEETTHWNNHLISKDEKTLIKKLIEAVIDKDK